jgi:hypothetical protein
MDEDDKVRRNLVIVSSAILLTAWLGVPTSRLIEKALSSGPVELDAGRVWSALLFVLWYLFLRYHFSRDRKKIAVEFERDYGWIAQRRVERAVRRAAAYFSRTGKNCGIFQEHLGQYVESIVKDMNREIPSSRAEDPAFGRPKVIVTSVSFDQGGYSAGSASVDFEWNEPRRASSSGGKVLFDVGRGWRWRWFVVSAAAEAIFYSQASIQTIAPVALWAAAMIFVTWRLIQSLV